jgi:hypothetical protein
MAPPQPPHKLVWKKSTHHPAPFFAQDPKNMNKELKVDRALRVACLDLYRMFNRAFKASGMRPVAGGHPRVSLHF